MIVRMWEATAHPEAHQDLLTWVCDIGVPELEQKLSYIDSQVYTSTEHRVVVVSQWRSQPADPSSPPSFYLRHKPQSWDFSPVDR